MSITNVDELAERIARAAATYRDTHHPENMV